MASGDNFKSLATSFARGDVIIWDDIVAGVDASCGMMESSRMPSGAVASNKDYGEDGLDGDRMESAAAVVVGDMGATKEGMVILETGAGGGSTDAMMWMELASETL